MLDLEKLENELDEVLENETEESLKDFFSKQESVAKDIIEHSESIPAEFAEIINEHFWEMV